jgi:hypothetical protein
MIPARWRADGKLAGAPVKMLTADRAAELILEGVTRNQARVPGFDAIVRRFDASSVVHSRSSSSPHT